MRTKQFDADLTVDVGSRTVLAVISTDAIDRDGEVVLPSGLEKAQYSGNPVVLYAHDSGALPIGKTLWVKSDGKSVLAKYYVSDKTQFARDVFGLLQDGVLKAHSIGFIENEGGPPTTKELETRPELKDCRKVIRSWSMLEFSVVPIPCNPEALALSVAKCCDETKAFLGKAFEKINVPSVTDSAGMPEEDCCEWKEEPVTHYANRKENLAELAEKAAAQPVIPQPKYCRPWKTIEKKLKALIDSHSDANEIIAKLKGRA